MCWKSIRRHVFDWKRSQWSDWRSIKKRHSKKVCIHHCLSSSTIIHFHSVSWFRLFPLSLLSLYFEIVNYIRDTLSISQTVWLHVSSLLQLFSNQILFSAWLFVIVSFVHRKFHPKRPSANAISPMLWIYIYSLNRFCFASPLRSTYKKHIEQFPTTK